MEQSVKSVGIGKANSADRTKSTPARPASRYWTPWRSRSGGWR